MNVWYYNDERCILFLEISSFLAVFFLCVLPGSLVPCCMKWYISEDMMPFGGEYVMIWNKLQGYQIFFLLYLSNTATTFVVQELRF